jgi:hypothetical protein
MVAVAKPLKTSGIKRQGWWQNALPAFLTYFPQFPCQSFPVPVSSPKTAKNGSNAEFSIAIRRSSAESLAVTKSQMTISA